MTLTLRPTLLREARRFVDVHHSHLDRPQGGLFAVGVENNGVLVCVAILGLPVARLASTATPHAAVAEVTRVASDGTAKRAASMALGAIARAALSLGWTRLISYTLLGEAATTYRACGWRATAITSGGEHSRRARPRRAALQPGVKVRWETGPHALPVDAAADRAVRDNVGLVPLRERAERTPLFAVQGGK